MRITVLNILGDAQLVQAAARGLTEELDSASYDILVTAELNGRRRPFAGSWNPVILQFFCWLWAEIECHAAIAFLLYVRQIEG